MTPPRSQHQKRHCFNCLFFTDVVYIARAVAIVLKIGPDGIKVSSTCGVANMLWEHRRDRGRDAPGG